MEVLIVLATIMAIFGVLGYQRGTRASVFMAAVVVFGLALINRQADKIGKLVNGLYFGIRFVLAGGLQALGGSGNKGEAIDQVIKSMGEVKLPVREGGAGLGFVLAFALLVLVGLLVSRAKWFKGRTSVPGLVIGLANGYLISAYLVRALTPDGDSPLPLPLFLTGERATSPAPTVATASGAGLLDQMSRLVTETLSDRTLAIIIVVIIALFVFLATRFSNKPAKKG